MDLVSPSNTKESASCDFCSSENVLVAVVCASCGAPMSRPSDSASKSSRSFFSLFGFPEAFGVDVASLTRQYYDLSRQLHPDRFRKDGRPGIILAAEDLMSELNEAFETLKDSNQRREYLLKRKLSADEFKKKGQLPMELAEQWFEVQELLEEPGAAVGATANITANITAGTAALKSFRADLSSAVSEIGDRIAGLEKRYDALGESSFLVQIHQNVLVQNVLHSLVRDVEKTAVRLLQ